MKKMITAALLLILPLTACAAKDQALSGASTPAPSSSSAATATSSPANTPVPSAAVTPAPANATIAKTYRMNKNYDFVPIDPNGNKKVVLLTFDDGPKEKAMIEPMLDTLDKHKAKAIFFLNGYRIKEHPELLKLLYSRGQIIGNHSYDHINLKKEADAKVDQQLKDVQKMVKDTIGVSPAFFRPPFGSSSDHVRQVAKEEKMLQMNWSNGSLDWDLEGKGYDTETKSKKVIENVFNQLHGGSNILMHELPWTVQALDTLLTQLEEKGYSFLDPRAIDFEASQNQ